MRVKIYRQFGALNSKPVFDSLATGLKKLGHEIVEADEEMAVIWSVLWSGRMQNNSKVYASSKKRNIPVMIVEVGNLKRNITWRLSLDNINGEGKFANIGDLNLSRIKKLGVSLKEPKLNRGSNILIACQHQKSLQWQGLPSTDVWVKELVNTVRQYSDRKIVVRPHPRNMFNLSLPGVFLEYPKKINTTYDDFDINYDVHAVINHNSGPAVQAAIEGTPVVCDRSSLAYPVSDQLQNIERIQLLDREKWFLNLCHTEWTLPELESGEPIEKILTHLG